MPPECRSFDHAATQDHNLVGADNVISCGELAQRDRPASMAILVVCSPCDLPEVVGMPSLGMFSHHEWRSNTLFALVDFFSA